MLHHIYWKLNTHLTLTFTHIDLYYTYNDNRIEKHTSAVSIIGVNVNKHIKGNYRHGNKIKSHLRAKYQEMTKSCVKILQTLLSMYLIKTLLWIVWKSIRIHILHWIQQYYMLRKTEILWLIYQTYTHTFIGTSDKTIQSNYVCTTLHSILRLFIRKVEFS